MCQHDQYNHNDYMRVSIKHEEIVIERAGKPIARLGPVDDPASVRSGKLDIRTARGLGGDLWKTVDVDAYLKEERQQWN